MAMGCDGVFVGSGIFKSAKPAERAAAIVSACTYVFCIVVSLVNHTLVRFFFVKLCIIFMKYYSL